MLGRSILPHEVALEERIGEGQFGDVLRGILHPGVSGVARGEWGSQGVRVSGVARGKWGSQGVSGVARGKWGSQG